MAAHSKTCACSRAIRRWRACSNGTFSPAADAFGDWLRRTGSGEGLGALARINQRVVAARLKQTGLTEHTLDGDASQIVAEKHNAQFTYKGEPGYMPRIGHLAEAGVIVHDEFREGNVAPATDNLGFIKACEEKLPKGHRIAQVRLDAVGYQAGIFNYCEATGKRFAIGGRLDAATRQAIAAIPDSAWKHYADCAVAATPHSMNGTHKAFRLIGVRHNHQGELFDERPRYHVIASNRVESTEATLIWYRQRGEVSENGIKELKIGFAMERMPCGQFEANAAFFRIGLIAHNLFVSFKRSALGATWQHHQVATVRWRLFQVPGKGVCHAGAWTLKIAAESLDLFRAIRARSLALAQAMAPP